MSELYDLPKYVRTASSSSFTQSRDKVDYNAFVDASRQLTDFYYNNYQTERYAGMRLVAVDGSVLTAPKNKETLDAFGDNVFGNGKWVKMQVSFATDVLSNICLDAEIGPYKECERSLAAKHLDKLGDSNLYIFDRGYYSRDFLHQVYKSGSNYCFRLKSNAFKEVSDFVKSESSDTIITVSLEKEAVKVRLTKIILDTGEVEILLTSLLDKTKFTAVNLKKIYHLRWKVEEQYKDIKYAVQIENFIGKKANSVKQEFFATIMTYNLAMMTAKPLIDRLSNKGNKKHKYQTNKRALLSKFKQCFISIFYKGHDLNEIINSIVKIVAKESVPIIKERKFKRGKTYKAKIKYNRMYSPI